MRLIDAESIDWTLIEEEYGARTPAVVACQSLIQNAPTIDPVRHGRWLFTDTNTCECSVCHTCEPYPFSEFEWCPNCGAKMDGGKDETD